MSKKYSIVMFAHNEEQNIRHSIKSVFDNVDERLDKFTVIANGCTDKTVSIIKSLQEQGGSSKLELIELAIGDKCNAWNRYIHEFAAPSSDMHFFLDADVRFTEQAFPRMCETLFRSETANAIAGLPFSGRNHRKYKNMVTKGWCLFGNCYGLKFSFVALLRKKSFRLPIGLGWIDSAITKVVNQDAEDMRPPEKGRIVFNEQCGYKFNSLSVFNKADWQLYISRITRYRLGKLQEKHLEELGFLEWPANLLAINQKILDEIASNSSIFNLRDKIFVANRIKKIAISMQK